MSNFRDRCLLEQMQIELDNATKAVEESNEVILKAAYVIKKLQEENLLLKQQQQVEQEQQPTLVDIDLYNKVQKIH